MSETGNQDTVLEEQEKETQRFLELNSKADRTEDEEKELQDLKTNYGKSVQKKIGQMHYKLKTAEEQLEAERKEREKLKRRLDEIESREVKPSVAVSKETVKIGEKAFYTDRALRSMIDAGEITEEEAIAHKDERMEEAASEKAYKRLKGEQSQLAEAKIRIEDAESVLKEYPHFSKDHPNFNPEDPLYRLGVEIYNEGYKGNPRGLSLALKRAKDILRISDKSPDISDDLSVHSPSAPSKPERKDTKVSYSENEKEAAIRMYHFGGKINPKTGNIYTEKEAIEKGLAAKKRRLEGRNQ